MLEVDSLTPPRMPGQAAPHCLMLLPPVEDQSGEQTQLEQPDEAVELADGTALSIVLEGDMVLPMKGSYENGAAEAVARAAGPETPDAVVLGSDTIVVLHEKHGPIILGKPASRDEALAMLLHLSGRTHTVYTGCCIIWLSAHGESRTELFYDAADVTFAEWPEDVLRAYAATGECDDKAGSYAIQGLGSFLVSGIKGQWATIVGLPVLAVAQRLMEGGSIAPRHCLGTNPLSK